MPYDLGLGVSAAIINEAVWELWKAGALCIAVETDDLATLSAGADAETRPLARPSQEPVALPARVPISTPLISAMVPGRLL